MTRPDTIPAYDALIEQIKLSHKKPLTDEEAHKIARNLMGFSEKVMQVTTPADLKE